MCEFSYLFPRGAEPREGNSASARTQRESTIRSSHSTPWPDKAGVRLLIAGMYEVSPRIASPERRTGTSSRGAPQPPGLPAALAGRPAKNSSARPSRLAPHLRRSSGVPAGTFAAIAFSRLSRSSLAPRATSERARDRPGRRAPARRRRAAALPIPLLERHQIRQVDDVVAHDRAAGCRRSAGCTAAWPPGAARRPPAAAPPGCPRAGCSPATTTVPNPTRTGPAAPPWPAEEDGRLVEHHAPRRHRRRATGCTCRRLGCS